MYPEPFIFPKGDCQWESCNGLRAFYHQAVWVTSGKQRIMDNDICSNQCYKHSLDWRIGNMAKYLIFITCSGNICADQAMWLRETISFWVKNTSVLPREGHSPQCPLQPFVVVQSELYLLIISGRTNVSGSLLPRLAYTEGVCALLFSINFFCFSLPKNIFSWKFGLWVMV